MPRRVTVAPEMTAPFGSVTVPLNCAPVEGDWATEIVPTITTSIKHTMTCRFVFMQSALLVLNRGVAQPIAPAFQCRRSAMLQDRFRRVLHHKKLEGKQPSPARSS